MERFGELEVVMSPPVASGKFSLMSASKIRFSCVTI